MNSYRFITVTALIFLLSLPALAQEQESNRDVQLTYDGVVYEYKAIPNRDSNGRLMYYTGQMSGKGYQGEPVFFQKTRQSPGCDKNFPAISLIDVPYQTVSDKKIYVLFCGTYSGKQNTLRFYDPELGMVSSFNLGNYAPVITQDGGVLDLIIYREIWPQSLDIRIIYPTIYNLYTHEGFVKLIQKNDDIATRLKYEKILDAPYYSTTNNRVVAEKLIILSLAGNNQKYCSLVGRFANQIDLLGEIEASLGFPLIKCKEQ